MFGNTLVAILLSDRQTEWKRMVYIVSTRGTSAASSYLHHSLTVGLQEKMAAEGFEPTTKDLGEV